jgi:hypothetical protein
MKWQPVDDPAPALLTPPRDAASLDDAHEAIGVWEHYTRKTLRPDQRRSIEHMMARKAGGRWAARSTFRAEARQNGKGEEVEVVELFGVTQLGEAIVHTAHEIPTAKNAQERLWGVLQHKDFRGRATPRWANGDREIAISGDNGGIIVYRTRTAGGGRGLDDISRIVVDEAQHAQPEHLASAMPILMANPNPQRNFTGTSGILGRSDWWWTLRLRAMRGDDDGFAALEHSAERVEFNQDGRVISTPPDPADRSVWPLANPGFGVLIEEAELAEQLAILGPDLFAREHLGVWDPFNDGEGGVVPFDRWQDMGIDTPAKVLDVAYGLSVPPDSSWAAIGSAGHLPSGATYVDTVQHRKGTGWVVDYLVELYARDRLPVRIDPTAPEAAFKRALTDRNVEVVEVSARDYQQACASFLAGVVNGELHHNKQESLTRAVSMADRRDVGHEGAWVWTATIDISTLKAATLALSGIEKRRPPRIHVLPKG